MGKRVGLGKRRGFSLSELLSKKVKAELNLEVEVRKIGNWPVP